MNFYDILLAKKLSGGDAPAPVLITKSVTANGEYSASDDSADGYSSVSVDVPNSYSAGDEGKVVQSGALVTQTATSTTTNGTIDTTMNNSIVVNVANSYVAADEGKVVSNGALVAQGSDSVTQNGTVDTTLISSLVVNVSGGAETMYKLTTDNSILSNSDLYITATNLFVYVFGTLRNTSSSVNVIDPVFSVPAVFDMGVVGTFKRGARMLTSSPTSQSASTVNNTIKFTGTYNYGNSYSIFVVFNLS